MSYRERAPVRRFGDNVRELRLGGFEHVGRGDAGHVGKWMVEMKLSSKRIRGRSKNKFMDTMRVDVWAMGMTGRCREEPMK